MSSVTKIVIWTCTLVAFLDTVCALECYQCIADSNSHPCGDEDFSSETTVTEVVPSMECKYCFKTKGKNDGQTFIARGCLYDLGVDSVDDCIDTKVNNFKARSCLCSTDRCNGVGKLSGTLLLTLTMALFKYMW